MEQESANKELIAAAIREGRWLFVDYKNAKNENTKFWIFINNINVEQKSFETTELNIKNEIKTNCTIYFEKIQKVEICEFITPREVSSKLIETLEICTWLNSYNNGKGVLNYYRECYRMDIDLSQKNAIMIEGIDIATLKNQQKYKLNDEQAKQLVEYIYNYHKGNNREFKNCLLGINELLLEVNGKLYVLTYYKVTFNPKEKSLACDDGISFNTTVISGLYDTPKTTCILESINIHIEDFLNENVQTRIRIVQEALDIKDNSKQVKIDTQPKIMILEDCNKADLSVTYRTIEEKIQSDTLPKPLKSFFGMRHQEDKIIEPSIMILDKKINISQMRVVYNAMRNPVTFVQGPPGTGKTQTIINVILSVFYNGKTALVCFANNNPVDGIANQLRYDQHSQGKLRYRDQNIPFPILRLGKKDVLKDAIQFISQMYDYSYPKKPIPEVLKSIKKQNDIENCELIKRLNEQEILEETIENIGRIKKLRTIFPYTKQGVIEKQIDAQMNKIADKKAIKNEEIDSLIRSIKTNATLESYLFFKSLEYINKLKEPEYARLISICKQPDSDERIRDFKDWINDEYNMRLLTAVFPVICTTNQSSQTLGTPKFMFDLVIMDEASQCQPAIALLPIAKAKSLLLVGDPMQLSPITSISTKLNQKLKEKYKVSNNFDFKDNSILDLMIKNDTLSKYILLKYHYRCSKKIIGFSNGMFYQNQLDLSYVSDEGEISIVDTKNVGTAIEKNLCIDEAQNIVDDIKQNKISKALIITPFRNQKNQINKLLKEEGINDVACKTVHEVQGGEEDTVFLSVSISDKTRSGTYEWLATSKELNNVAITRAKKKLIVYIDLNAQSSLKKNGNTVDYLDELIEYIKRNGESEEGNHYPHKIKGKSNGSINEDKFYATLKHFCTCNPDYFVKRNVNVADLFKDDENMQKEQQEFDIILFNKEKEPKICIELNGPEHYYDEATIKRDKHKVEICKAKGIEICAVKNENAKDYITLCDIIMKLSTNVENNKYKYNSWA